MFFLHLTLAMQKVKVIRNSTAKYSIKVSHATFRHILASMLPFRINPNKFINFIILPSRSRSWVTKLPNMSLDGFFMSYKVTRWWKICRFISNWFCLAGWMPIRQADGQIDGHTTLHHPPHHLPTPKPTQTNKHTHTDPSKREMQFNAMKFI